MIDGSMSVKINKEILENQILPKGEVKDAWHGIMLLNQWIIPHWDWVDTASIGSVQVNMSTVDHILNRLKELFPFHKMDVMMLWVNYGWKIRNDLQEWECRVDFEKINYKKER